MKRQTLIALFIGCTLAFPVAAQTQDSYDYTSEFTWGINKNTHGGLIGGLVFKKARKTSDRILETFGLEIMNVKHPQEQRYSAQHTGNFFIYGKSHYLYALRFQYGRDIILFKKAPQQGVEIKGVFAVGPTIGLHAPYYVEISADGGAVIRRPYNTSIRFDQIYGPGRLFEGVDESNIKIGANAKAAINFELGTVKSHVTGFEAGFLLDAYAGEIELIPSTRNPSIFPTFFFTLFYGGRK